MSSTKHTPGPWRIGSLASYDGYTGQPFRNVWAGSDDGATVVARAIRSEGAMTNDVDADARLIAAAPELLEVATWLVRISDRQYNGDDAAEEFEALVSEARAAIAKAKGE